MIELVTVCSHNRTRSVIAMVEIRAGIERRVGAGVVSVTSLGFGAEGLAPIGATVDAMQRRGIDVSGHRSRRVDVERLDAADLILTAERDHVMRISTMSTSAYRRSFTFREFLSLASEHGRAPGQEVRRWAEELSASRTAVGYLGDSSIDLADPTGTSRRRFGAAVDEMGAMCAAIVEMLLGVEGADVGGVGPERPTP